METMKNTQQKKLIQRINGIIKKELNFLDKAKIEDEDLRSFAIIRKEDKEWSKLEDEAIDIIKDVFIAVESELQTSLRFAFKYDNIKYKYSDSSRGKDFRIDFKRLKSLNLSIKIDYIEVNQDGFEGYYLKPFAMTYGV